MISSATERVNRQILQAVAKVNASSRVVPIQYFLYNPHYIGGALYTVKASSYVRLTPTTKVVGFVANDMLFDFDNAAIRMEYNQKLEMLGAFLQETPGAFVVAAGFTDSIGAEEYNIELSRRRAASVRTYLVDNYNIDKSRIQTRTGMPDCRYRPG
jgi:OOP family OmpA-OmpF porin